MARDFSPEEKLLKLIRSNPARRQPAQPAPAASDKPKEPVRQEKRAPFEFKRFLKWENLNVLLMVVLAGLLFYFVPSFIKGSQNATSDLETKIKTLEKPAPQKIEEPARPPFNYYSESVGARNIFSPAIKDDSQGQAPQEEGPKLEDIKSQLSLLGVVSGAEPQAIIEDKRTQKTYFLNKGSTFDDIRVGDILENKVILFYKDKEFELVL
ncbi:MAG: hypothetical protein PHO42_03295 [Candidatus Omnitrophica bacterium]|nr:hypothetical protein [Candidatus Omnitrophota bacterium]